MRIFSISGWTADQWIAFTGVTVAGLAAVALLGMAIHAVRSWDTPSPTTTRTIGAHVARPTLALAARRTPLPAHTTMIAIDPVTEHLAPGVGSLSTLAAVGEGSLERVELVDRETAAEFSDVFARWQRSLDTRLLPAMLTAVRWAIEGAQADASGATVLLHDWRVDTATGEWPLVPVLV